MTVLNGEFVLRQDCVATIAEAHGLNLPVNMAREPLSYDSGEWEGMLSAAHAQLAEIGLLVNGSPSQALLESLRVLCTGSDEFYGLIAGRQQPYYLHVAALGQQAVFAALAGDEVLLRPGRAESLVAELLAELPEARPAGGRAMSAPAAQVRPPSAQEQAAGVVPRGDARRLLGLFGQNRYSGGQLFAAVRGGVDGRRLVSPEPIAFLDVDEGRWISYVSDNGTGGRYVNAAPGRMDTLAGRLQEAQRALRS